MNLRKRIKNIFSRKRTKAPRRFIHLEGGWDDEGIGWYPGSYEDFQKGIEPTVYFVDHALLRDYYKKNEWVRSCVDALVSEILSRGWEFYPFNEKVAHKQKIKQITDWFDRPNLQETSEEVMRQLLVDWLVTGDAYLEILFDKARRPVEIYVLDPQYMKIKCDKHGIKTAYHQKVADSSPIIFRLDEVIHWRYQPMSNSIYGLSPLETLLQTAAGDLTARDYNNLFFKNNATPRLHIDLGERADENALKRFRIYYEKSLKGKPFKNIITDGNATIKEISISNKDMQYGEFQKMNAAKIMSVYGVPPIQIGVVEQSNRFNAKEQREIWKETRIQPLQRRFAEGINELIRKFGFDYIGFRFKGFEKPDELRDMHITVLKLKHGLIPINEWRMEQGLDPVEWGDKPLLLQSKGGPGSGGEEGLEEQEDKPDQERDVSREDEE